MFLAITILGGMTAALIALKLWAAVRDRPSIRDTSAGGIVFETTASTIDDYVSAAARWWPHLKWQPTFWVAAFITAILVVLDFHFGYSRGGWAGLFVLGSLFAAADIAIPFVAMKSDKGVARWHELDARDRDPVSWALIVIFTCMSFVVVIGSTAEVASTTGAAKDVGKLSYEEDVRQIGIWQAERDAIRVDRGYQALADLADATEKASEREGGRTRCGDKCEKLKQEAADYRARAADAKRKEELTGKIEAAKARLSSGQGSEARLDADPLATAIDGEQIGFRGRGAARAAHGAIIGERLLADDVHILARGEGEGASGESRIALPALEADLGLLPDQVQHLHPGQAAAIEAQSRHLEIGRGIGLRGQGQPLQALA